MIDAFATDGDFAALLDDVTRLIRTVEVTSSSATRIVGEIGSERLVVTGSGFVFGGSDGDALVAGLFDSLRIGTVTGGSFGVTGRIDGITFTAAALNAAIEAGGTAVESLLLRQDWRFTGTNGNDRSLPGDAVGGLPFNPEGDDILDLLGGNDRFHAGDGNDIARGGDGNDNLNGGRGNDRLFGGADDDRLLGSSGSDVLDGGTGQDQLTGGAAADRFVFADGYGRDRIADFDTAEDRIDLRGLTGIDSFRDVRGAANDRAQGLVIDAGGGDVLILAGVLEADIRANDFIF